MFVNCQGTNCWRSELEYLWVNSLYPKFFFFFCRGLGHGLNWTKMATGDARNVKDLRVLPVTMWVFSRYSGFVPQSKHMLMKSAGDVVPRCQWMVCVPHAGLPTCPGSALVSGLATVGIGSGTFPDHEGWNEWVKLMNFLLFTVYTVFIPPHRLFARKLHLLFDKCCCYPGEHSRKEP